MQAGADALPQPNPASERLGVATPVDPARPDAEPEPKPERFRDADAITVAVADQDTLKRTLPVPRIELT
jgi:hypothetical protein